MSTDLSLTPEQFLTAESIAHVGSWRVDIETQTVVWSPELYRILGRDAASFRPDVDALRDCVHEGDIDLVSAIYERAFQSGESASYRARIVRPDGVVRWTDTSMIPTIASGSVVGFVGTLHDVTDRHLAEVALRESDARYRAIVETTSEGIWAVDRRGRTTFVNSRMADMLGYPVEAMLDRPLLDFLDESARDVARDHARELRAGSNQRFEMRLSRRNGTDLFTTVATSPIVDDEGQQAGWLAMLVDLTEQRAAHDSLERATTHDELTGLPSRALLVDRIESAVADRQQTGRGLAVMCCGLDQFRFINESLGHDAGDQVLIAVAERLVTAARPDDMVARLGSDEYVICCQDLDDGDATEIATRVAHSLAEPVFADGHEVFLNTAIGIRLASAPTDTASDLLRDAAIALYQAKLDETEDYVVFDDSYRVQAEHRLDVESGLHHAIANDEFRLYYQPTVSVDTGAVSGAEALIRWQHPTEGIRSPLTFIGIAERTGLIVPIGMWVLATACHELRRWNLAGSDGLTMAVNLSPRQLQSKRLVQDVAAILLRTKVKPSDLCVEITENVLMRDPESASAVLGDLKDLGLRLAIDDFGTGHSSLANLRRFPIDILKIDQSFIAQLGVDPESTAIVTSVIHMAKALNLEIIAEGVETEEQLSQLRLLGCDTAQGFLWSKPVPSEDIRAQLNLVEPAPAAAASAEVRNRLITVLIADDEVAHRRALRRTLERSGHFTVVAEAGDGLEAIQRAEAEQPDLVVLDLSMPKMDGLEALPRILAKSPGTKVTLLSGHFGRAPLVPGASLQLTKGIDPAELIANLLTVVDDGTGTP